MSDPIDAIVEELERLRAEGVREVFVEDATLGALQGLSPAEAVASAEAATEKPEPAPEPKQPASQKKAPAKGGTKPLPEAPPVVELPEGGKDERMAWLRKRVEECPVCNEHLSPHGKVVFGIGSVDADIFFCGEAPGADEERSGEPFVGRAGQLLTKIIEAMGLSRESVYIGNILKWRPEHDRAHGNRPPTPEEMNFCLPYVKAQIAIVKPKVLVALGNTAVTGLLGPDPNRRMGKIRGTWQTFEETPLMVTFHPSYLLRNQAPETKRLVWEDMLQVMERADLAISERQRSYFLPKKD